MNLSSYIILGILILLLSFATLHIIKSSKTSGCSRCSTCGTKIDIKEAFQKGNQYY